MGVVPPPLEFILQLIFCSPNLVDPDFILEIEVYCSIASEDFASKSSTPVKMLKKLRHKVWRSVFTI